MKCVVAMMQHETNTFSPLPTSLAAFGSGVGLNLPPTGEQAIGIYGAADFAFAGMLAVAKARGVECVVPVTAYAEPSGKVDDDAFVVRQLVSRSEVAVLRIFSHTSFYPFRFEAVVLATFPSL